MKVLNGQFVEKLRPEILLALRLMDDMYAGIGEVLLVTWCEGGKHMEGSLHYKRRAFDVSMGEVYREGVVERMRKVLGVDYDVVVEKTCIHVEWDPK